MISSIFRKDIEEMITSSVIPWEKMKNSTVLITGATGLIGNALTHALTAADEKYELSLRIMAHGRNAAKCETLSHNSCAEVVCGDIRNPLTPIGIIADSIDYIFHCAAITRSADMVARPVDVIEVAIDGTRNVLELARKKRTKSVVYLSSMEVYGQTVLNEVCESDLGYLDLTSPRSCYPESKRLCESLCVAYCAQYGVPVKIARLAQTFGAGTPQDDPRVFAQFSRSAIAGEDIVLHTEGKSRGNYCCTADTVRALLILLLMGKNGQSYNIANPAASVTVREMAELVAAEFATSVAVDIPMDIEKRGYAPDAGFRLNVDKIENLGWTPRYGLAEIYRRMIVSWRASARGGSL